MMPEEKSVRISSTAHIAPSLAIHMCFILPMTIVLQLKVKQVSRDYKLNKLGSIMRGKSGFMCFKCTPPK